MGKMLREGPGIDLISLSPTDGHMWRQCEECRKLDERRPPNDQRYSRRQMVLYNRVADELEKEFPDQLILVGAYNLYTWPPKDAQLRAHRNLAVVICPTSKQERCMPPISIPGQPLNRPTAACG